MPRRNYLSRGRSATRRESLWLTGPDEAAFTTVVPGGSDLQGSLNAAALGLRPFTVVRTVGLVAVYSDQGAAREEVHGAYGVAVVSDQASAVGVTAIPSPITDEGSDLWLMFQFVQALDIDGAEGEFYKFDSKAMRKVEDGQDLVLMFENGSSTAGLKYLAKTRILIKLH